MTRVSRMEPWEVADKIERLAMTKGKLEAMRAFSPSMLSGQFADALATLDGVIADLAKLLDGDEDGE